MITRSPGDPAPAALKRSWVLRTPRARLTTWLPEDLPELSALHADPRVTAVTTTPTSAGLRMDAVATGAAVSDGAGTCQRAMQARDAPCRAAAAFRSSQQAPTPGTREGHTMSTQVSKALLVRLEALPGREDDVRAFLEQGLSIVEGEARP